MPAPGNVLADLDRVEAFGSTSLTDAVAVAANEVSDKRTRRAVVVLTDGQDTSSRMTAAAVATFAASIDVPVYVLVPQLEMERNAGPGVDARLIELAHRTGGQVFVVTTPSEISFATDDRVGSSPPVSARVRIGRQSGLARARRACEATEVGRSGSNRL